MASNLYIPYDGKWFRFEELLPKSTLNSSNTRIYLGEINWPISSADGTAELNIKEYERLNQSLSPSKIILPKDYKTSFVGFTKMFKLFNDHWELAASLVFDQVNDLVNQAARIAQFHPHSLCYLLDFDEPRRELTLIPNLLLFLKRIG
ncbi:hypothetical protein HYW75_03940 [Candidatus Pacearchaeota archaeon]|nr:hypothetical protein [Candidatus Pacearchaeota archaeon]